MIKFISEKPRSTTALLAGQIDIQSNIKEISGNMSAVYSTTFLSVTGSLTFSIYD